MAWCLSEMTQHTKRHFTKDQMYTDTECSRLVNIHLGYKSVAQTKVHIVSIFTKERRKRRKEGRKEKGRKGRKNEQLRKHFHFPGLMIYQLLGVEFTH